MPSLARVLLSFSEKGFRPWLVAMNQWPANTEPEQFMK